MDGTEYVLALCRLRRIIHTRVAKLKTKKLAELNAKVIISCLWNRRSSEDRIKLFFRFLLTPNSIFLITTN